MRSKEKQNPISLPSKEQIDRERIRLAHRHSYRKALSGTICLGLTIIAITILISSLLLPVMQIMGDSMQPSLSQGDLVLLVKTERFHTGDICCFSWNNRTLLKRVIGVAGDWIEMNEEGTVYVNGKELEEPYVTEKSLGECNQTFPYQVPENSLFVLGDCRKTSIDSRNTSISSVSNNQMIGKVLFRIWPLKKLGRVK